ncbi:MAG: N-6 DNA methylase, partial [Candidatus Hydrogenedentes bacterium]|nr:N-6 DNA methylase [Candidatus Hydrogenedentota bacterium]
SSAGGDIVGDAYQCFRGSDVRGQDGQFFTPLPAIRTLVSLVDPKVGERVIDPACGAGGFILVAARHLAAKGATSKEIAESLCGVEKDAYLARLARMRLSLLTLRQSKVFTGDSLSWQSADRDSFMPQGECGSFDVVLTNPPFGTKIVAASESVRKQFVLAHRWVPTRDKAGLEPSQHLLPSAPPQVLFVERCISLVREGGRIGMVVPESLLCGKNYRHVVEYIRQKATVEAVIGMPDALFKTSGKGGTHTKTVLIILTKRPVNSRPQRHSIFMAEATWCGHDSRGRPIPKDDTPTIVRNYQEWRKRPQSLRASPLGYAVSSTDLKPGILAPRAYDPELPRLLASLESSHVLVGFGDLVKQEVLSVSTGDEVGKLAYGTGEVPFVRTSDMSNWEIKLDPKHGVSREVYEALKRKQDVREGDILMVRDGTYLIGTCALVTKYDTEIVLQSHIYKIRVANSALLDPYLLLAVLSSPVVQRQIRAQSQTQDIINSLGNRIHDLVLPIPRDDERKREIAALVQKAISDRIEARELARQVVEKVIAPS